MLGEDFQIVSVQGEFEVQNNLNMGGNIVEGISKQFENGREQYKTRVDRHAHQSTFMLMHVVQSEDCITLHPEGLHPESTPCG